MLKRGKRFVFFFLVELNLFLGRVLMMKFSKSAMSLAVASVVTVGAVAPVAAGELSASAGVATSYLWRGYDLGAGDPAVSASLDYSEGMFYAGAWVSSGDASAGTEYDLYMGLAGDAGGVSWDVGIVNYVYPTGDYQDTEGSIGDFMEMYIGLGMGPVSLMHYSNIETGEGYGPADSADYTYTTIGMEAGSFGVTYGMHDGGFDDYDHLDLSYSFNDSLSFTYSIPMEDSEASGGEEPVLVASYSFSL
jgi:uncharacterized protein (TIGR02001 family)